MKQRLDARFEGRVQGVGFRFTCQRIARTLPVTGFVQNLPDGSVRLVAEGRNADLNEFLQQIEDSHLGRGIMSRQHVMRAATGEFADFQIRYR